MGPEKRIWLAVGLVLFFLMTGTAGYVVIDDYTVIDAFYMTVITITTVGYGEIQQLSELGRIFTIFLILFSVGSIALLAGAFSELLIERAANPMRLKKKMEKKISKLKDHIIICGHGRVGAAAAEYFHENNAPFVVIENQEEGVKLLDELGYCYIKGDGTREETLKKANIKKASAVLAVMNSDPGNLFAVLTARELNPVLRIIARTESASSESRLLRAGADSVISPPVTAGRKVAKSLMTKSFLSNEDLLSRDTVETAPEWIYVTKDSEVNGKEIRWMTSRMGIRVLGYRRSGRDILMPDKKEEIKEGDEVLVLKEVTPASEIEEPKLRKKIVLIDDNPVIIRLYTRLFQKAGYHVSSAVTGHDGYDLIANKKPDAAVVDFHLPDMSGIEICEKIRTSTKYDDIKLILFTADELQATAIAAMEAGADKVVVKSPDAGEIVEQVSRYLE